MAETSPATAADASVSRFNVGHIKIFEMWEEDRANGDGDLQYEDCAEQMELRREYEEWQEAGRPHFTEKDELLYMLARLMDESDDEFCPPAESTVRFRRGFRQALAARNREWMAAELNRFARAELRRLNSRGSRASGISTRVLRRPIRTRTSARSRRSRAVRGSRGSPAREPDRPSPEPPGRGGCPAWGWCR